MFWIEAVVAKFTNINNCVLCIRKEHGKAGMDEQTIVYLKGNRPSANF